MNRDKALWDRFLVRVRAERENISPDRKRVLEEVAGKMISNRCDAVVFVCTHNSRRSQLAQVWAEVFAHRAGIGRWSFHSAGTEVTSVPDPVIRTLKEAGLQVTPGKGPNRMVEVGYSPEQPPLRLFSKDLQDPALPEKNFLAVMVCSDADANCPYVPGAIDRVGLTYVDPKKSDGTPEQSEVYAARSGQIAAEMSYLFQWIQHIIPA